jgi:SAM-dependent methyltransferase
MNNTFNSWANVEHYDLDVVSDLIVTGRKAKDAVPDKWLLKYLGDPECGLKVMDFGCGMGRNTFEFGIIYPRWTIVGYDNKPMLTKTNDYYSVHYSGPVPENVKFITNWDELRTQKFDTIFCSIVLQHIYEDALKTYINDFKKMTSNLIVTGRRFNDDIKRRSTWTILEDNGLVPVTFLYHDQVIDYKPEGNDEDHNTAIYSL